MCNEEHHKTQEKFEIGEINTLWHYRYAKYKLKYQIKSLFLDKIL